MMSKTLFLIAGANGSGKTTLAKELLKDNLDVIFLNADEIALEINDPIGLLAGKVLLRQLDELVSSGRSIVLESTISGKHHYRVIRKAQNAGYVIHLLYIFIDIVEISIARVRNRAIYGGHNIPETDIRRRYMRSLVNFWETKKLTDTWKLYHNNYSECELIAHGNEIENILNRNAYRNFKGLI
jgi:predicted ABC-type ATPase